MEKKIIGYRCVNNRGGEYGFTISKIYQLCEGKSLDDVLAFIDDSGNENGWSGFNHIHFEPVYEGDNDIEPNPAQHLTYDLDIDFNKLKDFKSNLIKMLAENNDLDNNYILELIDSIQDYAVDNHNIPRSEVFNINEEFGI